MNMTHPFEKAGLGIAPFKCTHVSQNIFTLPDGTSKAGGCCDYCGTGIRYEFWIKGSVAGAKQFKVGCDCVAKTGGGIQDFDKVRSTHTKERRQAGAEQRAAARRIRNQEWIAEQHAARSIERAADTAAWRATNPELAARLDDYTGTNDFLKSMIERIGYWGTLSAKQTEAAQSCFAVIDRTEATRLTSTHLGTVGAKSTITLKVMHIVVLEGMYGTNYIHICEDTQGNSIIYKGKATGFPNLDETATVIASVKEHGERNGIKQTIIQRPKIIVAASL